MKIFNKNTEDLMHTLQNGTPAELKDYFQEYFGEGEPTFPAYIDALLAKRN